MSATAWVRSGGAALAVTSWGSDGPGVVALHPGVGDRRTWQWCAPTWATAGHRVVAYDRRGFGETLAPPEPHDDLDDLLAVTAALDLRPAVIVGNSNGGRLAVDLALAHPDHVRGLVLISPDVSGYPSEDWPASAGEALLDELVAQADEAGDLDRVNELEVWYWLDGADQPEGRVGGAARELLTDMNARALRAAPIGDAAPRPAAWPELHRLTMPVLVVVGEHDLPGFHLLASRLVDAAPRAELVHIAGSAHCPSLDRPDGLDGVVLEFLASLLA